MALESFLIRQGHNSTRLWQQIDEIIVTLLIENEAKVVKESGEIKILFS